MLNTKKLNIRFMNNKIVSIIVPAYNRAKEIVPTLETIVSQTYPTCEIIIVDDGSTDNTSEVVKSYISNYNGSFMIRLVSEENKGLAAARNFGFSHAKGDYILFFDSDDFMLPNRVERQVKSIEEESADCSAAAFYRQKNGQVIKTEELYLSESETMINQILNYYKCGKGLRPSSQCWMFTRKMFEELGGYDERLRSNQDIDFGFRIALSGKKIAIVNEPLSIFVDDDNPNRIMKSIWKTKKGCEYRGLVAKKLLQQKEVLSDLYTYNNALDFYLSQYIGYSIKYMGRGWGLKEVLNIQQPNSPSVKSFFKKLKFVMKHIIL